MSSSGKIIFLLFYTNKKEKKKHHEMVKSCLIASSDFFPFNWAQTISHGQLYFTYNIIIISCKPS